MKKVIKSLVLILYIFTCFVLSNAVKVFAAEIEYTDVLYDLQKDSAFKSTDYESYTYSEILNFYTNDDDSDNIKLLQVISIAEGNNKELFIYVYNPLRENLDFNATSILMFCSENANPKTFTPIKYNLSLVSTNYVFDKYLVENFRVSDEVDRYYNLVEINRPYIQSFDDELGNGTIDEKAISIGQQWYTCYYNDELIYESCDLKVLELSVIVNSYIFFDSGFTFTEFLCSKDICRQVYYIVFTCDNYIIKKIFDADLNYDYREVEFYDYYFESEGDDYYISEGELKNENVTLYADDKVKYTGVGLNSKEYIWNRICTGKDFKDSVNSQNGKWFNNSEELISDTNWVFIYSDFSYEEKIIYSSDITSYPSAVQRKYTETSNVDIFRISFLDINDNYYNLGVVVDATTAEQVNVNFPSIDYSEIFEKIMMLIGLIILILILVACGPVISVIFSIFGTMFNYVFKFIISIIKLPFKLFTSNKNKKPKNRL